MEQAPSVEDALLKLTYVKGIFFEKYYMLLSHSEHLEILRNQTYSNWRDFLINKETGLLTRVFENAVNTGELKPLDLPKTSRLLLETLYAFSRCVNDKGPLPDKETFKEVLQKQQEVIQLFYQPLKSGTWAKE